MGKPSSVTVSLSASDADGICTSQTPAAGGEQTLTINGALASGGVATLPDAGHVLITAAGNESARTITVTGTNRHGDALTEAITGPNATTAKTTLNFKTVTEVKVDDDTAGALQIGTADSAESAWIPLDIHKCPFHVGFGVVLSSSASLTYTVQHTFEDLQQVGLLENGVTAFNHDDVASKTANEDGNYAFPVTGLRLSVTGHTTGSITLHHIQAGASWAN